MKNTISKTAINLFKRIRFITNHTLPYLRNNNNTLSSEERTRRIESMYNLLSSLQEEYTFELNPNPIRIKKHIAL